MHACLQVLRCLAPAGKSLLQLHLATYIQPLPGYQLQEPGCMQSLMPCMPTSQQFWVGSLSTAGLLPKECT